MVTIQRGAPLALRVFAASVALSVSCVFAQTTTNISLNLMTTAGSTARSIGQANASVSPFGLATLRYDVTHPNNHGTQAGDDQGTISFVFNRVDSFDVSVDIPAGGGGTPQPIGGSISGGSGAYAGATGSATLTLTKTNNGPNLLSGNGSVTAAGNTTSFTFQPAPIATIPGQDGDHNVGTGSGTVTPIGDATLTLNLDSNTEGGNDGIITLAFNASDSFSFFFSYNVDGPPPPNTPAVVVGGTGAYAGATGTITFTTGQASEALTITGSGSITQSGTGAPIITEVSTAFGLDEIAQNTYIAIRGTNLVPSTTPPNGVDWSNAPELASGQMPTQLQGISVSVNGQPAYVYFFCSAATDPACASDQITVLTPLDARVRGKGLVIVNNNGVASTPFVVLVRPIEPTFLLSSAQGDVLARHADGSLVGPTTPYPGYSTPAQRGETITVLGVGFGLPTTPLVAGSSTQSGSLPQNPACFIGTQGPPAPATATLISPGLYEFQVGIPMNAPQGDDPIYCSYTPPGTGQFTPAGNLITVE